MTGKEPFFLMSIIQALRCQRDLISSSSLVQQNHHLNRNPVPPWENLSFQVFPREIPNELMAQQLAMCEGGCITYFPQEPLCLSLPSTPPTSALGRLSDHVGYLKNNFQASLQ